MISGFVHFHCLIAGQQGKRWCPRICVLYLCSPSSTKCVCMDIFKCYLIPQCTSIQSAKFPSERAGFDVVLVQHLLQGLLMCECRLTVHPTHPAEFCPDLGPCTPIHINYLLNLFSIHRSSSNSLVIQKQV